MTEEIPIPTPEEIEDELLKRGDFKEEARQIPLDKVEPREAYLLIQYLNDELETEDENELKTVLQKYRPALQKYDPTEMLDNITSNHEYNKAEKKFLDILRQQSHEKTLTMNYPLDDGTTYPLRLVVLESDSQFIDDLQTNYKLFEDLTPREQRVRGKAKQGQPLTREEKVILESIQERADRKVRDNEDAMIIDFLAHHTYIQGEEPDIEGMKEIYSEMDKTYMKALYERVARLSGFVNPDMDELFQ